LAVGLDSDESVTKRAVAPLGLSYTLLIDEMGQAVKDYKITSIPLNVIVDKKGVIRYRKSGYDPEGMKKVIEELL